MHRPARRALRALWVALVWSAGRDPRFYPDPAFDDDASAPASAWSSRDRSDHSEA